MVRPALDGSGSDGVDADIDSIMEFARTKAGAWESDAKKAHATVEKLTLGKASFTDTRGGTLYGEVYAAAHHTYDAVLKGLHADLATAKEALMASARLMSDNDDAAAQRMAELEQKWSTDAGFSASQASNEVADSNRDAIVHRTQAAASQGQDIADGSTGDGPPTSTGDYPQQRETDDGEQQYQASRP